MMNRSTVVDAPDMMNSRTRREVVDCGGKSRQGRDTAFRASALHNIETRDRSRKSLLPIFIALIVSFAASAQELRVGAAAVKITPEPGIPLAGYYFDRGADGTHDELLAKTLVIESGGVKAALVVLDLISTTAAIVQGAREEISRVTDIPGAHVMISATHTHTGPILSGRGARDRASSGGTDRVQEYTTRLPGLIAESVREANSKLQSVRATAAIGRQEHLSFNRRFHMRDGSVGWNAGKLNTNIVRPAGPIDPDVAVVYFEATNRAPVATYVNFAMHPDTVGGNQFSADYPFTLSRLLAAVKGSNMVTVFANGTCGNINHIDVKWSDPQKGHSEAARIGTVLAAAVLQAYKDVKPVRVAPLQIRSETVKLPLPAVSPEDVAWAREIAVRTGANEPKFIEKVRAFKTLDVAGRDGNPLEVEVQVIAFGDVAWVSLPGEIFVELGLAIKQHSPFRVTCIAELANGSVGYVPNKQAYPEGNYEVLSARCDEGSGELLVEAALRMLRAMHKPL